MLKADRTLVALSFVLLVAAGWAQPAAPASPPGPKEPFDKDLVTTHHHVVIDGVTVYYAATAGSMPLPDYDGKTKANVFFVAYTRENAPPEPGPAAPSNPAGPAPVAPQPPSPAAPAAGAPPSVPAIDPATRPITYAFNGGPGSSSVWLHLGALGPRRVVMQADGQALPPPYTLAENEQSWLDATDLVFIDPVSTGYSRPVDGESGNQFHGLNEDIRWVGDFIRLYTTRFKRWSSPKFLAGESYGTTRAAGLSGYLQDTHGMYLNGIILISPVLNFQTIAFDTGNDLPYPLYLPTYAATAWYHHKLAPELQKDLEATLREVRAWALGEYTLALAKGDALPEAERAGVIKILARYTGLSERYIAASRLRVSIFNFTKELLRDQDQTVGRLDSRFKGVDANSVGSAPEYDPSMAAITGPYTAAFNNYVRTELTYQNDQPYEILTGRVQPWNYANASNRYVNVAETLRQAMTRNPSLRVMIASGYYDLATPFFAAEYTISHLGLPPSMADHIGIRHYQAGHMMYIRREDLAGLKKDAAEFMRRAAPAGENAAPK